MRRTVMGCGFGAMLMAVGGIASAWAGDVPTVGIVSRGELVYQKDCAACHGDLGNGSGPAAPYLSPRPRDFTTGMYKFRSTPSGELPSDTDLMRILELGVPGTQMPPWKGILTLQERMDVIAYIKTFSSDFKDAPASSIAIPEAPAATPASIESGRMVYMLMECWSCHGGKGKGDGKSGKTLQDDWGRKILPWDLTKDRYKSGNDPASLYRTFTTGLNGTPMPAYALEGFLIGGDAAVDPAKYSEAYKPAEIDRLKAWLLAQPTETALQRMSPEQRNALGENRKWALVHYIRSLIKERNFLVRMFTEDTETTR
jgi:mono/diheme cytochrome c family protein